MKIYKNLEIFLSIGTLLKTMPAHHFISLQRIIKYEHLIKYYSLKILRVNLFLSKAYRKYSKLVSRRT